MSKKWGIILLLAIFLIPLPILAIEAHSDEIITVAADQVVEGNFYAAANVVEIYGTVNGDIFAIGGEIYIDSDNINGDVFAIGKTVTIQGDINGSVRMAAAESMLVLGSRVKNLMSFGKELRVDADSSIDRHLTFFGEYLTISGPVGGKVEGLADNFRLDNSVAGDVDMYIGSDSDSGNLQLTEQASIGGTLYYKSLQSFDINEQATLANEPVHNSITKKTEGWYEKLSPMKRLIEFFGLLVVGMLFIYLAPRYLDNMYLRSKKHWLASIFKGLAFLIVTPALLILLAITVIGIPLALISLALWLVLLCLAKVLSAWLVGSLIKEKFIKNKKLSKLVILAIGILVLILVSYLPVIGGIFVAVVYFLSWGIFYDTFYKLIKK